MERRQRRRSTGGYEDCAAIQDVKGYYTSEFRPPARWLLDINDRLTREISQRGDRPLNRLLMESLCALQQSVTRSGVQWGNEARLVVKGSRGATTLFAPKFPDLGSFSRADFEAITGLARRNFAHSDIDVDLLACPTLDNGRFLQVRRVLVRCATECLARLRARLEVSDLMTRLVCDVARRTNTTPSTRRSFVVQNAFAPEAETELGPPPHSGMRCVSILAEVGSMPTSTGRQIRVPVGKAYVSTNELHFMNGKDEVRFTLCRCMLAFMYRGRRAHAEILDITVPYLTRSQLITRWNQPTVRIPLDEGFGEHARVLAPLQQLQTLQTTYNNAGVDHKMKKRARRILVMLLLLTILRCRVKPNSELRHDALCLGATVDDLAILPARIVALGIRNGTVGLAWARLAARVHLKVQDGNVFWQPHDLA